MSTPRRELPGVGQASGRGWLTGAVRTPVVRLHDRTLSALTLLRRLTGHLPEDDLHLAQALADSATPVLMHGSTEPTRGDDVITRVQSVIAAKTTLEIAKGMIAEYAGVPLSEAARLLNA
ncbi:hypothetical protein ACWDBW_45770 [Streptomyces sp. NPDC001107]